MSLIDTKNDFAGAKNPLHGDYWIRPMDEIEVDLADLRAQGPVFIPEPTSDEPMIPTGPGGWMITNYADIKDISKRAEVFSSASGITSLDAPPEFNEFFSSMIAMDDPRHARLRRLVSPGFTPRMLKKLEESVDEQAKQIIDEVAEKGECDFVVDVAARLPLRIVCDLMGVPQSETQMVFDNTNLILGAGDPEFTPPGGDLLTSILTAGGDLAALMTEVAKSKEGGDGDDLTSILVNAEVDGEKLSYGDLASFFILLVVAGNETTRNAISWGLHLLTENPEQREIWSNDFEAVSGTAIEEIVRIASPVTYMRRTALSDVEVNGKLIKEGDKLFMNYLASNRDETVFEDPYRFDVLRDPNPHLGFGGPGPHFCMGAHLARREIMVMFRHLFDRLPDIQASGPPVPLSSGFIHGIKHLPATFTPVSAR